MPPERRDMKLNNWSLSGGIGSEFLPPELQTPHLQGDVYGNDRFPDGTYVHTSRIVAIEDKGTHKEAITESGSVYEIYKEDVDPAAEKQFPGYYERLEMKHGR